MKAKLTLLMCESIRKETEYIVKHIGSNELELVYYSSPCFECVKNKPKNLKQVIYQNYNNTMMLSCFNVENVHNSMKISNSKTFGNCQSLLLGNRLAQSYIAQGNYLITPGLLKNWKHYIMGALGLNADTAKAFFKKNFKSILLLDTNMYERIEEDLKEFSSFVGLDYCILQVGLEHFKNNLMNIYQNWKLKNLEKIMNEKNKLAADFRLVLDFIEKSTTLLKEEDLINRIFELFVILTGASNLSFLPVVNGEACEVISYNDLGYDSDLMKINEEVFYNQYKLTSSGNGLILKFSFKNDIIGYLEIENILFPNYIYSYLELSKTIINTFSLMIFNSRIYEQLQKTEIDKVKPVKEVQMSIFDGFFAAKAIGVLESKNPIILQKM